MSLRCQFKLTRTVGDRDEVAADAVKPQIKGDEMTEKLQQAKDALLDGIIYFAGQHCAEESKAITSTFATTEPPATES